MLNFILLMGPPAEGGGFGGMNLLFLLAIFAVMYFFMIRPQTKKAKEQRNFMSEIKKGDKVVTVGGMHGRVAKVDETSVLLEVDTETKVRVEKSAISLDYTKAAREKA